MKLSQLEQAIEVARTGSLAKAAQNLYISQANLSISIKNLEEEAGSPIFSRTNRGMELTNFGQQFISYAQSVCFQMGQLEDICTQNKTPTSANLKVLSACYSFVPDVLANVCKNHPNDNIRFTLNEGGISQYAPLLSKGIIDVAVTAVHSFNRQVLLSYFSDLNLEFHYICSGIPGIYVSADDERFPPELEYVEPEMLSGMIYIDYDRTNFSAPENKPEINIKLQSMLGIMGISSCLHRISIDNRGAKFDMIKKVKGFSSAAYCKTAYDKIGFQPGIRFIPWKDPRFTNDMGYLTRVGAPKNPLVDEFIAELKKLCVE